MGYPIPRYPPIPPTSDQYSPLQHTNSMQTPHQSRRKPSTRQPVRKPIRRKPFPLDYGYYQMPQATAHRRDQPRICKLTVAACLLVASVATIGYSCWPSAEDPCSSHRRLPSWRGFLDLFKRTPSAPAAAAPVRLTQQEMIKLRVIKSIRKAYDTAWDGRADNDSPDHDIMPERLSGKQYEHALTGSDFNSTRWNHDEFRQKMKDGGVEVYLRKLPVNILKRMDDEIEAHRKQRQANNTKLERARQHAAHLAIKKVFENPILTRSNREAVRGELQALIRPSNHGATEEDILTAKSKNIITTTDYNKVFYCVWKEYGPVTKHTTKRDTLSSSGNGINPPQGPCPPVESIQLPESWELE